MSFSDDLTLIADRSAALRAAVAAAPDLDARVPSCPEWTLRDLVAHLGGVQRFWSVVVAAGPADDPPQDRGDTAPHGDLLAWFDDSTRILLEALTAAGPDTGCWTWWIPSPAPKTAGAVARHQVQEAAVHAWDAQLTVGSASPIPAAAAVDGIAEFLEVSFGSEGPWPHRPARVTFTATEGPTWT